MGTRGTRSIRNLREHNDSYVTPAQLADYWNVSRKQIYKQIEAGTLRVIRFGPRLMRIRIVDAIEFEAAARMVQPEHDGYVESDVDAPIAARPYAAATRSERHGTTAEESRAYARDSGERGGAMIESRHKRWR